MTINSQKLKCITCAHKNTRWPQCSCLSKFNRNILSSQIAAIVKLHLYVGGQTKQAMTSKKQNNLYYVENTDKERVLKEPLRAKNEISLNVNHSNKVSNYMKIHGDILLRPIILLCAFQLNLNRKQFTNANPSLFPSRNDPKTSI